MKTYKLLFMSVALTLISFSCGNDSDSDSGIQVRNFANTGCKPLETRGEDGQTGKTVEYIEYKGMEDGFLSIKHVNTSFNCLHGELRMHATVTGNEISILEEDYHKTKDHLSFSCDCPYDLYCEIGPLADDTYTIVVYKGSYQYEIARSTISYSKSLDGEFSVGGE